MRFTALQASLTLLLLAGIACSDPGQAGDQGPVTGMIPVQGVKVTPQSIVFAALSDTFRLSVTIVPANATDQATRWESTDPTVAAVDAAGLVTARAVGSGVLITAFTHDGGYQSSVNVSVNP
jgi:uncharacterized protein YjdB